MRRAGSPFGKRLGFGRFAVLAAVLLPAALARAQEGPKIDTGDTAWMLTSSALVLMMTAPGLALFYGGLVRSKNVLNVLMQSFIMVALISIQWSKQATCPTPPSRWKPVWVIRGEFSVELFHIS